jgi:hypothetical protein
MFAADTFGGIWVIQEHTCSKLFNVATNSTQKKVWDSIWWKNGLLIYSLTKSRCLLYRFIYLFIN